MRDAVNARRLLSPAAALALALALAGCAATRAPVAAHASPGGLVTPARPRAEWLADGAAAVWAGRLGEAHRALLEIADREVGIADPALDFWSELVALLRCEPVRTAPRPSRRLGGEWDQLRRLVQVERLRLAAAGRAGQRLAVSAPPAASMTWPIETESWNDEGPAAVSITDHCAAGGTGPASTGGGGAVEMMMVRELTAALPASHPALPALLFEQAVLEIAAGAGARARDPLERIPASALREDGVFSAGERAELALTWALAADAAASTDPAARPVAIARLRAAVAADLPRDTRRGLVFRLAERLRAAGLPDEAADAVGPPPHGDDRLGRYLAFQQVDAHVRAGRRGEALAEAREALGRHRRNTVDADPALSAIDDLVMRLLVASPISAESIEVIETLGVPSETLGRVERFAQIAGAMGAHASAAEAFLWLMQSDPDENRRLHHLARASVAAARAGDRQQFGRTFALLAGQPEGDSNPDTKTDTAWPALSALPAPATAKGEPKPARAVPAAAPGLNDSPDAERLYRSRHRDRSLSWQRAMLVVARDALPALVENDDQANLKILVDRLQKHLTAHGRGPVDAELTTVYRAASAHLRQGARGYAERVGGGKRPILLGDVAVERHHEVMAPGVTLVPRGPRSLLWVPRVGTDPSVARLERWRAPLGSSLGHPTLAEAKK